MRVRDPARGRRGSHGGGGHGVVPRAHRALQDAAHRGVRPAAEDVDGEGAEVHAARAGEGALSFCPTGREGDSATLRAVTRVNAEQASKRVMRKPARR